MGKLVGLAGALTAFGAVAYLMAPVPQDAAQDHANKVLSAQADPVAAAPAVRASAPPSSTSSAGKTATRVAAMPPREAGTTLVHQIQVELHRVGCYSGAIDGRWSEATQRAMQALGERVSVLRPVDTPDYIMLALARGQQGDLCGARQQRAAEVRPTSGVITTAAPTRAARPDAAPARRPAPARRAATTEARRSAPVSSPSTTARRGLPEAPQPRVVERDPAELARIAAAREELDRLDARRRAAGIELAPVDDSEVAADPATLERSRMGLGAANVDPLRAGIDPRDPGAPAILRGPPQPAPVTTARIGGSDGAIDTIDPPRRPPLATSEIPAARTFKQKRRVWQRGIFNDMQRNGP